MTRAGSTISQGPYHALNDFVVARGAASRVVTVAGNIDGAQISTFRADGLILSTATGSTGYNLAVGGPILDPESDALVLKTVAAHMGLTAALVLRSSAEVSLQLEGYQPPFSASTATRTMTSSPATASSFPRAPTRPPSCGPIPLPISSEHSLAASDSASGSVGDTHRG